MWEYGDRIGVGGGFLVTAVVAMGAYNDALITGGDFTGAGRKTAGFTAE